VGGIVVTAVLVRLAVGRIPVVVPTVIVVPAVVVVTAVLVVGVIGGEGDGIDGEGFQNGVVLAVLVEIHLCPLSLGGPMFL
jgi:hypothetical protein